MGNFEKLSVLVIVVIIVMILVVALYTWTGDPSGTDTAAANVASNQVAEAPRAPGVTINRPPGKPDPSPKVGPPATNETPKQIVDRLLHPGSADPSLGAAPATPGAPDLSDPGTPPVTLAPPVAKEPRLHVVAAGETIAKIAKLEYPGLGQKAIDGVLKANPTLDPTRMPVNFKLLLPDLVAEGKVADAGKKAGSAPGAPESIVATLKPGTLYVTKKGDTLQILAKRAYRDSNQWHRIWVENFDDITDTDHLQPGLRLRIPVL